MGCENCKIGGLTEQQIIIENGSLFDQKNLHTLISSPARVSKGLLSENDRQIWLQELNMNETPDLSSWKSGGNVVHQCFVQIKKDVVRTFPGDEFLSAQSNLNRF